MTEEDIKKEIEEIDLNISIIKTEINSLYGQSNTINSLYKSNNSKMSKILFSDLTNQFEMKKSLVKKYKRIKNINKVIK